jgi:chemotaxis protein CheD
MSPNDAELPQIYLKAGEIVFSGEPHIILTVLGSCLSVTMFHRRSGLSAISHGLLPHCRERTGCSGSCKEMAKYVECAFTWMLKRFKDAGLQPRDLEVKVFGGADMFSRRPDEKCTISVGRQNITVAQKIIESEGLTVISMDVGGNQGRKIFFNTRTGEVMLKRLQPNVVLVDPRDKK